MRQKVGIKLVKLFSPPRRGRTDVLFVTLSINHEPIAIYAAHNTGKKRNGKTLYDVYPFDVRTGKRKKKLGTVGHYPEEGAETLTRIALELV